MESAVDILSGTKTDTNMDYLSCLVYHAWLPINLYWTCTANNVVFLSSRPGSLYYPSPDHLQTEPNQVQTMPKPRPPCAVPMLLIQTRHAAQPKQCYTS